MPESGRGGRLERLLTPGRVFGTLAVLVLLALLLAPPAPRTGTPALSSYGTNPRGARGLYEILGRLGFKAERGLQPLRGALDDSAVYVVLAPPLPLTPTEIHDLLDAVRAGAGLLAVPLPGSGLADSLGLYGEPTVAVTSENARGGRRGTGRATGPAGASAAGRASGPRTAPPRTAPPDTAAHGPLVTWAGAGFVRWALRPRVHGDSAAALHLRDAARVFESAATPRGIEPVVAGFPLGAGRVVLAADPRLFTNTVIRQGEPAVRAVRLVEWLRAGAAARPIIFDEYHYGHGTHADVLGVARRALQRTPPGRVLLQLGLAALALLLAVAPRPIRPRPVRRVERRSPLEHVSALARAYAAASARDRAARLLVRGLRRRHGGARASRDEADYLRDVARRHPAAAADVERVLDVLDDRGAHEAGTGLAAAILGIERVIES